MGAVSGGEGEGETGLAAERQRRIDDIVGGLGAVDGDGAERLRADQAGRFSRSFRFCLI